MVARVFASAVLLLTASSALAQSPIEGLLQDLAANDAQREIGRLVENICPTGQINDQALQSRCNEIVGNAFEGNSELVRGSLQALAPEENLVVGSSLVDPSVAQVDVVQQRLATLRSGAGGGSTFAFNLGGGLNGRPAANYRGGLSQLAFPSLGLAPRTSASTEPATLNQDMGSNDAIDVEGRWGFFANGTASSVDRDPSARVSGFEADLSGATLGLDYRVTSAWVLGGAVGYEENDSELDFDGGSVDNETLTFSLQTSWFSGKSAWFEAIAGMGQTDIDQSRGIRYALPGVIVDSIAVGSTESDQTFASIATGWDFAPGAFAISPEIRFDYQSVDVDAFEETVTGINDLGRGLGIAYDAQDFTSVTGQVGVQIGYNVSTSWGVIVPQLNLSFIREFDDGADTVQGGFLGDSQRESYLLLNDDADTSYGQVGAGAVFVTRGGKSFYVFYDQLVSHEFLEINTFNVGLRLGF